MNISDLINYDLLELTIADKKISAIRDLRFDVYLKDFHLQLTKKNLAKVYILKENKDFVYVGTTMQSLKARLSYGLKADGKAGYHGYKWKSIEKLSLYVWCFENFNRLQIENIEAELVYLIRNKTGKWPLKQNEIHFNNEFKDGKLIVEELYKVINH